LFRALSTSPICARSIRELYGKPAEEDPGNLGTIGADSVMSINTSEVDARLPTPETMKQLFNGVPFEELPIVYVKATKNNTLIHCIDHKSQHIMYTSCRLEGFKNAKKKTVIAGQTTGSAAGQKLLRRGIRIVRVQVKGVGPGRMSSVKGMVSSGVNVVSITDRTPLKELGPRAKKLRRV